MSNDEVAGASRPSRRLTATALAVWLVLAFALPLAALTLNVLKIGGFPLGFWVVAQGALFGLVALVWIFAARTGGDRRSEGIGPAMAVAGETIGSAGFLGFAGLIAALGFDGLAYPLGTTAGLALLAILIAPRFASYPSASIAGFFDLRFGGVWPRRLAMTILGVATVLLLAANLRGAGLALQALVGSSPLVGSAVAAGLVALSWATGLMWPRATLKGLVFPILFLSFVATLAAVALSAGRFPLPHFSYGQVLDDVASLERGLIAAKLADARALKPLTAPFLQLTQLNFAGILLGLALGIAVLPQPLGRYESNAAPAPGPAVWRTAKAMMLLVIFLSGLAAYAALSRYTTAKAVEAGIKTAELPQHLLQSSGFGWVDVCGVQSSDAAAIGAACSKLSGHKGLVRLHDLSFAPDSYLFASSAFAGVPVYISILLALGALLAAWAAGHALLSSFLTAGRRNLNSLGGTHVHAIDVGTVIIAVASMLAALWLATLNVANIPSLFSEGLSLVASGLFPAIVLGLYWRRFAASGAVAAMAAGFAVAGVYILGVRAFPETIFAITASLSDAAPSAIRKLDNLRTAVAAANDAGSRAALENELYRHAVSIANWWGLKPGAAALLGAPAGFVAAFLATILGHRSTKRPQT